jgi:cytochrome bd-type quinol oxidase subunit 2
MAGGKKSKVSLMQTASAFVKRMNWLQKVTLSGVSFYFVAQSVLCIWLINQYHGSIDDRWRVVFASIALVISLLFVVAPFLAIPCINRKFGAQKKAI